MRYVVVWVQARPGLQHLYRLVDIAKDVVVVFLRNVESLALTHPVAQVEGFLSKGLGLFQLLSIAIKHRHSGISHGEIRIQLDSSLVEN